MLIRKTTSQSFIYLKSLVPCRHKRHNLSGVMQMVLKCADIGHLAAAPALHQRWAYQLEEEFFRQGDQEKTLGLPISPLMDRNLRGGMTKSQVTPPQPANMQCYAHTLAIRIKP